MKNSKCSNLDNDDDDDHEHLFFPLNRRLTPLSLADSRQDHFVEVVPSSRESGNKISGSEGRWDMEAFPFA